MPANRTLPGTAPTLPAPAAEAPTRVLVGMEPDPITRQLIEVYLAPLGYALRWVEDLEDQPGPHTGALAFLLSANALPVLEAAAIQKVARRLGDVPLLGLAGDRHRFPPETVPHPVRRVLRKPVRPDDLMAALEALLNAPHSTKPASPLDEFRAMVEEMGMDAEMVADLCASFIERGERYLLEAKAASDPRDNDKLDRIAHAFKGMAGNMRFRRMTELTETLRRAAKEQTGDVVALTRSLQVEFSALRDLLQSHWLKPPPASPGA